MRYLVLAVDYDGTLARDGRVAQESIGALERAAASGRKLVLVTGRQLDDLVAVFPRIDVFDRVVAENGAALYRPATRETRILAEPPPQPFVEALRSRGVAPLSVGNSIVATIHPNETIVLEVIRDLGLELHVIFNKGAVMVLPANVNKASGLMAALEELRLSPHNAVAIGDAENDHAMLSLAEYSVAVANSVPTLRAAADRVAIQPNGGGVVELIDDLLEHDLAAVPPRTLRRKLLLGTRESGEEVNIAPGGANVLIAGSSGSGKSTFATGLLERLGAQGYQFCIIDPEGDYEDFGDAIVFGNAQRGPSADEVLTALAKPDANVAVNLIGLPLQERPRFFLSLLPRLLELRAQTGRPHWILVDETHHLLPADWELAPAILTQELTSMIYVTVHPDMVAPAILRDVRVVAAFGENPVATLEKFCDRIGLSAPRVGATKLESGQALLWLGGTAGDPFVLRIAPSRTERRRHRRKYAEGELPPERSFYFRGPGGKLNLRAQNLILFLQLAEGVDDETWQHHLRRGDYSEWLRQRIKDDALANQVRAIERETALAATESRRRIKAAVEERYTLPAGGN